MINLQDLENKLDKALSNETTESLTKWIMEKRTKVYLFKFQTNYEEAGIIITTYKGLEYAKEKALALGAWDLFDITIIDTETEEAIESINFKIPEVNLNK